MTQLKPGFEEIFKNIDFLRKQDWLSESQKRWPLHLYHYTNIDNAISILSDSRLLSRAELEKTGISRTDIACPDIIENTPGKWKDFVRLYFRPRTPFQFRNEGIRSKDDNDLLAHCPVPVFFIFNARKILSMASTQFSNGNLGAYGVNVDDTAEFYLKLPFQEIYHDKGWSSLNQQEISRLKFHRHAEVIIPKTLDLSALEYIYCRSQAEFETLIDCLPERTRTKWQNKVGIDDRNLLFYCRWLYIESVYLSSIKINFQFNRPSGSHHFDAHLVIEELKSGLEYNWKDPNFKVGERKEKKFDITNIGHPQHYRVKFFLDNYLVYQNTYDTDSIF